MNEQIARLPPIKSLDGVAAFAAEVKRLFGNHVWFRGHSDESYQLVPHVFRGRTVAEIARCEPRIAWDFRTRAPLRYEPARIPADDDHVGWLTLMRHFELSTRLLDWTESALVAAYFAAPRGDAHAGALWALSPHFLAEGRPHSAGPTWDFQNYARLAFKEGRASDSVSEAVLIVPRETSLRMLVQQAVFTMHLGTAPLESDNGAHRFLACAPVTADGKKAIHESLAAIGVDKRYLFPSLDSLSAGLHERYRDQPTCPADARRE